MPSHKTAHSLAAPEILPSLPIRKTSDAKPSLITEQKSNTISRRQCLQGSSSAALLLTLSGCRISLGNLRKILKDPQVRILSMKVKSATLDALLVDFKTEVRNPNRFPIYLKDIDYALDVEQKRVLDGKTKNGIQLAANGKSEVVFPMRFLLANSAQVLKQIWKQTQAAYTLEAGFSFEIKGASIRVPVIHKDKAPVPKLPVVEVRSFRLLSLEPTGIKAQVQARVKNPNAFELPVSALDLKIYLNERLALSSQPLQSAALAARKSKTIKIDFDMDFLKLGMGLADLLLQQSLPWQLKWNLKSGKVPLPLEHNGILALR